MDKDIEKIQEAYRALKNLHTSANIVNDDLLREILELKKENSYLRELLVNADKNVEIQKLIVVNSLKASQEKHERDYEEILELKKQINNLKLK